MNKTENTNSAGRKFFRTVNVFVYGTTEKQSKLIFENLPNKEVCVIDCTDCFEDIIATSYIAVVINPDLLTQENIWYFNYYANEVGYYSEKIVFTKPHSILQNLNKNVKYTVFSDDYEFETNIKDLLLEASRSEKRTKAYSDTVSQTIRVLSEIRKHPYITTAELSEII